MTHTDSTPPTSNTPDSWSNAKKLTRSRIIREAFTESPMPEKIYSVRHNSGLYLNIGRKIPFVIHAQEWVSEAPLNGKKQDMPPLQRVLALHGWLDNAQSFSRLAPLLAERYPLHIVAYDDAGCGHSQWKPYSNYSPLDSTVDVLKVLHALEWDKEGEDAPHLLAHSRGAVCMMFFAASFPEHCKSLTMLDAFGVASREAATSALTLRTAALKSDKYDNTNIRVFRNEEEAAELLQKNYGFGMTLDSARCLVKGQMLKREGGISFSYDRALITPSTVRFTEAQVLAFVTSITAPVLLLTPKSHSILENEKDKVYQRFRILYERKNVDTRFRLCPSNGHHFHLNEPESCVPHIIDFFRSDGLPSKEPNDGQKMQTIKAKL